MVMITAFQSMNTNQSLKLTNLQLYVKDLIAQKVFYRDLVGLVVIQESNTSVRLGTNTEVVIELLKEDSYQFPSTSEAGLYHSALVYKTRPMLAATIANILETRSDLYEGSSDHGATEAFYFHDIEGNGVELYFDKPLSEVTFDETGKPIMGSVYIDEQAYIQTYLEETVTTPEIRIGHIHLKVGSIAEAKSFYVDTLKFDFMIEMPSALFVSKDNYHHHLGMNTWESLRTAKRFGSKYGLKSFKIEYLDNSLSDEVLKSVQESGNKIEQISENSFRTLDPWNNEILLKISK